MRVEEVSDREEKSRICEAVLPELPEWFGIEQAVRDYVRDVAQLPMLAIRNGSASEGFVSLKRHGEHAAELYVMGVRPDLHRRGIGTALLEAAESRLAEEGVEYLQVKTLGPRVRVAATTGRAGSTKLEASVRSKSFRGSGTRKIPVSSW